MKEFLGYLGKTGSNADSKRKYIDLNDKNERLSKLLDLVLVKATTAFTLLPSLFITCINFFVNGLGDESYFLPCSLM